MVESAAVLSCVLGMLAMPSAARSQSPPPGGPSPDVLAKIAAALPDKPYATPKRQRKLLVFTATRGFRHGSIPVGVEALTRLGTASGAYAAVPSEDIAVFEPGSLRGFDAVCMLNTTGELFAPLEADKLTAEQLAQAEAHGTRLRQSLLDFMRSGRGLVGIHAATDCFYEWPEYGRLIGGYFDGHPWHEKVTVRVEDRSHPLCRMFDADRFEIEDEIYQFKEPYSRKRQNVLLSLDVERLDVKKDGVRRADGDFAVSWARREGTGRVFYCSLGHRDEVYWNPLVLRYYLAGIQFALGDLDWSAPDEKSDPSAQPAPSPSPPLARPDATVVTEPPDEFTPLFNGRDLTGWKGLVGNPKTRAAMSAADSGGSAEAGRRSHAATLVGPRRRPVIRRQGRKLPPIHGRGLRRLRAEVGVEDRGGRRQRHLSARQPAGADLGSGPVARGLGRAVQQPAPPRQADATGRQADRTVEQVPRAHERAGERVAQRGSGGGRSAAGELLGARQADLHSRSDRAAVARHAAVFPKRRNPPAARRRPAAPGPHRTDDRGGWRELFNGTDLTGWKCKPASWKVENGELVSLGGSYVWTEQLYGDFVLELEFKIPPKGNSGVFFRTGDPNDPVQTGIEPQIYDTFGEETPGRNSCGAVYDCLPPTRTAVHKPGEWNHVVLSGRGGLIWATMNGERIIDMDLDRWTEAHKNPDGTPNKFNTAYKDMPRRGLIGFQDHGNPIWFRNVRVKPLDP